MDINHRISVSTRDTEFISKIIETGVEVHVLPLPGNDAKIVTIVIFESNPNWNKIIELVKTQNEFEIYVKGDIFETVFSEEDVKKAEWLRLIPTFEQGYPQPENYWPIKQLSYSNVCPKCGVHIQTSPMRIKKEPSMGKKTFMTLINARVMFCKNEVFSEFEVLNACGYEAKDVLIHKTSQPSQIGKQLYVPGVAQPGIVGLDESDKVICPLCNTIKYYSHSKGIMTIKKDSIPDNSDFVLSHEWFGSGLIAFRELFVSNRIARLILEKGWLGVRFKVVELI
jgi:hypothetical protein